MSELALREFHPFMRGGQRNSFTWFRARLFSSSTIPPPRSLLPCANAA